MKYNSDSNQQRKKRTIRRIIIIIILILLLISSCTAYKYFGRIGYNVSQDVSIDDNIGNKRIVRNINLRFDLSDKEYSEGIKVNLSDLEYKLSYTIKGIYAKDIKCSTSDANIATCVVNDGYVTLKLRQKGKVELQIQSEDDTTIYIANVDVEIVANKSNPTNKGDKIPSKEEHDKKKDEEKQKPEKHDGEKIDPEKKDDEKETSKSNDATLKSLSVGGYSLTPSFNKNINEYSINVSYEVTSIDVFGKVNYNKASVYVEGNTNLKVGLNTVNIVVTAEDGTVNTYKIYVNRLNQEQESEKYITNLTVNNATLTPTFDSSVTNYTVSVGSDVNSLDMSIVDANGYNHSIIGNSNFQTGDNYVYINSYNDDNTDTKQYVIKVVKDAPVVVYDARLTSLSTTVGSLEPDFNPDTKNYVVYVPVGTNSLTINATANEDTTISGLGEKTINIGNNEFTINTSSGDKSEEYKIRVVRYSTNLSSLTVNGYTYNPEFNRDVTQYSLDVPNSVTGLNVSGVAEDGISSVSVIGNNGFVVGDNQIEVKVTTPKGETKSYFINVNRAIDYSIYYVNSVTDYEVSYESGGTNNYKNIILNTNIFEDTITSSKVGNKYILSDGANKIEIESDDIELNYEASASLASLTVKASYASAGVKTITVRGYKDDHLIAEYVITFTIKNKFNVVLDANGGFFTEVSDRYEIPMLEGDVLHLSEYNTASKETGIPCEYYTLSHYNTLSDDSGTSYALDSDITISSDLTLYAIYDYSNTYIDETQTKTLYLTEVDIFDLEHNSYNNKIYPGIYGSYIINFKNNTGFKVKLKSMTIEEDNICVDEYCLNMGYVVKSGDNYYLGGVNNYHIVNLDTPFADKTHNPNDTYKTSKNITIDNIELDNEEEVELSLLWKWVDNNLDYKIGDYVNSNPSKDMYYLTLSFDIEYTNKVCN